MCVTTAFTRLVQLPGASVASSVALERWKNHEFSRSTSSPLGAEGRPTLVTFAPYTTHVFKVDLLYYLGIDRDADMAYLYYLPFSMLFTSGDNLHRRTAPLFLRPDQSFADPPRLRLH